jgi:hypothetical protein
MKSSEKNLSILKGILVPVEWDDKGNIISVALSTFNEEEYLITNYQKLEGLIGNLRQEVELTGEITAAHNKKSIFVHDYFRSHRKRMKKELGRLSRKQS